MADIELVIKIPENTYRQIQALARDNYFERIIANGTPLPKGHEKLIAEPTEKDIAKTVGGQNDFAECIRDAVKAVFDNAPTIIEADKTGSEDKDKE